MLRNNCTRDRENYIKNVTRNFLRDNVTMKRYQKTLPENVARIKVTRKRSKNKGYQKRLQELRLPENTARIKVTRKGSKN